MTPRILDKNGRELSVGDRVQRSDGETGEVIGRPSAFDQRVQVTSPEGHEDGGWRLFETEPVVLRCNDLELVETAKEAVSTATTKGEVEVEAADRRCSASNQDQDAMDRTACSGPGSAASSWPSKSSSLRPGSSGPRSSSPSFCSRSSSSETTPEAAITGCREESSQK